MNFSEALRAARESAVLTQAGAAAVIGIAKRTYCDWEAGNVIPHRYMQDGALRDLRTTKKKRPK
jgi:DNA-binding XRE family transcriptional regulator